MTGLTNESLTSSTSARALEVALDRGDAARAPFSRYSPAMRRDLLGACASALLASEDALVALAAEETRLPETRLRGELARTAYQLELYGAAIEASEPAEVDLADPAGQPVPSPDLRRTNRPIGLVLVFAASNFPFAFSVAGTDTAAALAAGCPVLVKAHPGHPRLSAATAGVLLEVLQGMGAPDGTFGLISGTEAGVSALEDPRVDAAAFTGSLEGGRHLFDVAARRARPIPFYGELGSLNPVVVGPSAARARTTEILDGFVTSFTMGAGQFCTKPGVLFWPAETPLPGSLSDTITTAELHPLLNADIEAGYARAIRQVATTPGVRLLAGTGTDPSGSEHARASLFETTAGDVARHSERVLVECFGPSAVLVTYRGLEELLSALTALPGALTASIHADSEDDEWTATLLPLLEERVGRVIWGQWPTGVAVLRAQHHGGPYPATTSVLHTSVGTHAIDRFRRPITYQNFPHRFLPPALRPET